jgi:hypothetical protein
MENFNQFIGQNYYVITDKIQSVAVEMGLSTCLIENNVDYNIDVDNTRVKVYTDSDSTIMSFVRG